MRNKKACQGVCRADWQWKYKGIQRRQDPCGQANLTLSTGVHWRELERPWRQNSLREAQKNWKNYRKITKLNQQNDQQILGTIVNLLIHPETHNNKAQNFFHGTSWELQTHKPDIHTNWYRSLWRTELADIWMTRDRRGNTAFVKWNLWMV